MSVVEENIFLYKTTIISLQILIKNQALIPATITWTIVCFDIWSVDKMFGEDFKFKS